jgi:hypothetical protein
VDIDRELFRQNGLDIDTFNIISDTDRAIFRLEGKALGWGSTVERRATVTRGGIRIIVKAKIARSEFNVIEVIGMKRFSNGLELSHCLVIEIALSSSNRCNSYSVRYRIRLS